MSKIKSFIASISAAMLIPTLASAEEKFYFAVSTGLGFVDVEEYADTSAQLIADTLGQTVNYSFDTATWVGKAAVGYDLTSNIAFEAGYFISGNIDLAYSITGASATESVSASGIDLALVYKTEAGLFGKLGAHSSEVNANASVTLDGTSYNLASATTSGNGLMFGVGYESKYGIFGYDLYQKIGGLSDNNIGFITYTTKF